VGNLLRIDDKDFEGVERLQSCSTTKAGLNFGDRPGFNKRRFSSFAFGMGRQRRCEASRSALHASKYVCSFHSLFSGAAQPLAMNLRVGRACRDFSSTAPKVLIDPKGS